MPKNALELALIGEAFGNQADPIGISSREIKSRVGTKGDINFKIGRECIGQRDAGA